MGVSCSNIEGAPAILYGRVNPQSVRIESGLLHMELETATAALSHTGEPSIQDAGTVIGVKWLVEAMAARWESLEPA